MLKTIKSAINRALSGIGYEIRSNATSRVPAMTYPTTARLLYFRRLMDLIAPLDGDVVECGVGRGHSLLMLASLVRDEGAGRKIWGFDSFEGFPEPAEEDRSHRNPKKGEWGDTQVVEVRNLLLQGALDREFVRSQVTLVKGFFEDSLPKYRGDAIALLHLDVDLYESYLAALRELYPKVVHGGVVAFDEYMGTTEHLNFPGAQRAIDEYFAGTGRIRRDQISGKYYVVKE